MAMPIPVRATGSHFYKYATTQHLERLKVVVLEHELFFPELNQMRDPTDGKPKFSPMAPAELEKALYRSYVLQTPGLSCADRERAAADIRELVHDGDPEELLRELATRFYARCTDHHRVYCVSKRWANFSMWENYAGDHSGYCLGSPTMDRLRMLGK